MLLCIKQSIQVIPRFGPFLDKTDGVTEETGLAGNATEISKNHAAFGAGPTLGAHDADGWYPITLTTTHTDTLGPLIVKSHDSATHLPVWMSFMVLPANVFDSLVSGSDTLDVTVANGGIVAASFAASAIDAAALADDAGTEIANAILDLANGIETNVPLRKAMRAILSAAAAKLSGAGTTSVAIRDVGDTKNRIAATVDADGNRTAVTLDLT